MVWLAPWCVSVGRPTPAAPSYCADVAGARGLQIARDDAPMFGRRWLKAPLPTRQLFLRPAEELARRGFDPFDNFGDLPVLVIEDLAQQEHRPRERRQLLQEHQKCHR